MIDRKEKILSGDEVQKILARHFGFPEEHTSLWFEGSAPDKYILRVDRDCAGIDGDPPPIDGDPTHGALFDARGYSFGGPPKDEKIDGAPAHAALRERREES